ATIDRIKQILADLERHGREPDGSDQDLIDMLERMAASSSATASPQITTGSLVYQVLERPLRPGEVPLDELERALRKKPGPPTQAAAAPISQAPRGEVQERPPQPDRGPRDRDEDKLDKAVASQSITRNPSSRRRCNASPT